MVFVLYMNTGICVEGSSYYALKLGSRIYHSYEKLLCVRLNLRLAYHSEFCLVWYAQLVVICHIFIYF